MGVAPGHISQSCIGGRVMSKGMERKKEDKKKPTRTLEEKRALKKEKKAARG